MQVKKNDTVVVIAGKEKGKSGTVTSVDAANGRVVVDGLNMVTKAVKPRSANQKGGLVKKEGSIDASNVMIKCPNCGEVTRVSYKVMDVDGKEVKVRICKHCGESVEVKAAKKAAKKATKKTTAKKTATKKTATKKSAKAETTED